MTPTNEDYELVGQWLDDVAQPPSAGKSIELTPAQKALAAEIFGDQQAVGAALDLALPAGVLHRVNARLAGKAYRRPHVLRRVLAWSSAVAAAAVLLVAVLPLFRGHGGVPGNIAITPPTKPDQALSPAEYVAQYLLSDPAPVDSSLAELGDQIADYQMQVALGESLRYNVSLAGMNEEMTQPSLEELETPAIDDSVVD